MPGLLRLDKVERAGYERFQQRSLFREPKCPDNANRMYSVDDLLQRVLAERADELKLHVGAPPVMMQGDNQLLLEGPPVTAEDAEQFLLSIANTRQRRDIRERGWAEFFYLFRGSVRFLVRARMEDGNVGFDIQ